MTVNLEAPPSFEFSRSTLAAQPFGPLLEARLTSFGRGEAVPELDARDELVQQHGFVPGGVVSYWLTT